MNAIPNNAETRGEWLFRTMHALYGTRFVSMWRGVDANELKRTWTLALHGLSREALQAGIAALRDKPYPPTLPEFLDLCRQGRVQQAAAYAPRITDARRASTSTVEANLARMRDILAPLAHRQPSPQWAFDMLARGTAKNGQPLTHEARRVALDAVRSSAGRTFLASASPELRERYRSVVALLAQDGGARPREPGDDDEVCV
ncbi:hypothetical protein KEH57_04305 [Burkholderia cenocepacia]|uniref:hypothetical protein n=1 Tax=Burkholderia cenocepacia TaxID=95486 RepID=UPI001BA631E2|nr:hypothetical protein [Burkholderia cenocepacia]QUO26158.1 hypothetical protein KEH57_04305 [Burkholderia cenocepacia]